MDFFSGHRLKVEQVSNEVNKGFPVLKSLHDQDVFLDSPSGANCGLKFSLMKLFSDIDGLDMDMDVDPKRHDPCSKGGDTDLATEYSTACDSNQNHPSPIESKSNINLVCAKDSFSSSVDGIDIEVISAQEGEGDRNVVFKDITPQNNFCMSPQDKPAILRKCCVLDNELSGGESLGMLPLPVECSNTLPHYSTESVRHSLFGKVASAFGESRSKVATLYSDVSSFMARKEPHKETKSSILRKRLIGDTVMFLPRPTGTEPASSSEHANSLDTLQNRDTEGAKCGILGRMVSAISDPRSKVTTLYSNLSSYMARKEPPKVAKSSILSKRLLQNLDGALDKDSRDDSATLPRRSYIDKNHDIDTKQSKLMESGFDDIYDSSNNSDQIEHSKSMSSNSFAQDKQLSAPKQILKGENLFSKNQNKNQNHQTSLRSLLPFRSLSSICMVDNSQKQRHFLQAMPDSADDMALPKAKVSPFNTAYKLKYGKPDMPCRGMFDLPNRNLENELISQDELNIVVPSRFSPLVPRMLATTKTQKRSQMSRANIFPPMMPKQVVKRLKSGSLSLYEMHEGDKTERGWRCNYSKKRIPSSQFRCGLLHTVECAAEAKRFAPLASKTS